MGEKDEPRPEPVVDQGSLNGDAFDKSALGNVTEVQGNSHYHETVTAAPLDPWSKTSIQLYLILLVAALNATASGFDGVSGFHLGNATRKRNVTTNSASNTVHLQLHQCYDPVSGLLSPHRAWFIYRHVS